MRIVWTEDRHAQHCRLYNTSRFPNTGTWWEESPPGMLNSPRIQCKICKRTWSL